jgi:DNA-directed RNA polymerase specialized sigma24 family protein
VSGENLDEAAARAFLVACVAGREDEARQRLVPLTPAIRAHVHSTFERTRGARSSSWTPDDLAQEVLLKLFRFRPRDVPEGLCAAKLLAWAGVTAERMILSSLRHPARRTEAPEVLESLAQPQQAPEARADERRLLERLAECAEHLEAPYDAVFRLALEVDELSADHMAVRLGELTAAELEQYRTGVATEPLSVRIRRARCRMDKWKSRMRSQLAECLEESLGPQVLPSGLRFGRTRSSELPASSAERTRR